MPKAEISWKRQTEDGTRLQVYVHHTGGLYRFFAREKRYDVWQAIPEPPLEDWLELLDAVQRLINRRRMRPQEEAHVKALIRTRFPDANVKVPQPYTNEAASADPDLPERGTDRD